MESVIYVKDLKRDYIIEKGFLKKEKTLKKALNGISFSVNKGEIFGLLGENGAGKTTTIKILISLLAPSEGIANVLGYKTFGEEQFFKNKINFIFGGEQGFYRRLSAKENLEYFANLYYLDKETTKKNIEYLLELVDLEETKNQRVETFSKGMIQRLHIAKALINDPEIIFMDEPTIGLDPVGAKVLRNIIKELKNNGKTILLTTHYLHEAEELCDSVAILKEGSIIAEGTPQEIILKSKRDNAITEIIVSNISDSAIDMIESDNRIISVKKQIIQYLDNVDAVKLIIEHKDNENIIHSIVNFLKDIEILSIQKKELSLEEAYINLMKG